MGAGLPFEPWDTLDNETPISQDVTATSSSTPPAPSGVGDFVADLDIFLDFWNNEDIEADASASGHTSSPFDFHLLHTSTGSHDHSHNEAPEAHLDVAFEVSLKMDSEDEFVPNLWLAASSSSELSPRKKTKFPRKRSTSTSSTSSSDSSSRYPCSSGNSTSLSSAEDSDTLSSLDDDSFIFPTFYHLHDSQSTLHLINPSDNFDEYEATFEPRTSSTMETKAVYEFPSLGLTDCEAFEGSEEQGNVQRGSSRTWNQGNSGGSRRGGGVFRSDNVHGIGGNGLGGSGDDKDDEKRANRRILSTPPDSDTSGSDDNEEDSTDDYGDPAEQTPRVNGGASASDDDVPLAQRIPTALKAQKTIRQRVRDEREQRRKARTLRATESASTPRPQAASITRTTVESLQSGPSSSQEAALHATRIIGRPRTKTLPAGEARPFLPQSFTKAAETAETTLPHSFSRALSKMGTARSRSTGRGLRDPGSSQHITSPARSPPILEQFRSLHPMLSSHRMGDRKTDERRANPVSSDAEEKITRSPSARLSSKKSCEESRKHTKAYPESRSTRSSGELDRSPRPNLQRPPIPPLPMSEVMNTSPHIIPKGPLVQQRVFIGDMQRFNMVEIGPWTNASDVIAMIEAQGSLKEWVGSGDWMIWEVAQDFGMGQSFHSACGLVSDIFLQSARSGALNF